MEPTHPQNESSPPLPTLPTMPIHPWQEAMAQQDQMRRLCNARASQRAARQHRINRT
jgi:hypothetical protein